MAENKQDDLALDLDDLEEVSGGTSSLINSRVEDQLVCARCGNVWLKTESKFCPECEGTPIRRY